MSNKFKVGDRVIVNSTHLHDETKGIIIKINHRIYSGKYPYEVKLTNVEYTWSDVFDEYELRLVNSSKIKKRLGIK